jgi:hypothetical protein
MSSSSGLPIFAAVALCALGWSSRARAQAQGFAVERLYPSAPGGGWFVMDNLDTHGGLGGVMALSVGYAHDPLRVRSADGARVDVISDETVTDFGFAATYERWRLYLNLDMPIATTGQADDQSGTVGAYRFSSPHVDLGSFPDTLSDARLGVDVRLLGRAESAFRLGAGAQLLVPNGSRADYDTDGTFRGMLRALFAGSLGTLRYAGQLGVHIRPLDDSPIPGSPQGSELLFGIAAGPSFELGERRAAAFVVGPELYGATAFKALFGTTTTAFEGLVTARLEGTRDRGPQLRLKVGMGSGIDARFGAPDWRFVVGFEVFDHHRDPVKDGP